MLQIKKWHVGMLLVVILGLGCLPQPASADTSSADLQLSLTPGIFDLGGKPGSSSSTQLRVKNTTKEPQLVQATARAFQPLGKVDKSSLGIYNAASWLSVNPVFFTLDPGEIKTVMVTAGVPDTAEPGGHYASVDFTMLSKASIDAGAHVYLNTRVSGLALITVRGPERHSLSVGRPYLDDTTEGTRLNVPVVNTGTIHELTTQTITVKDIFGGTIAEWQGVPTLLLPAEHRTLALPWQSMLPGWYKVQVGVNYSTGKTASRSPEVIIAVAPPLWMMVLGVVAIAAGLVFWRTYGRWRQAWRTLWKK